jgi:hypothetical protein
MDRRSWNRRAARSAVAIAGSFVIVTTLLGSVVAAPAPPRATALQHLDKLAEVGKNYLARLRPEIRNALSSGGQTLVHLAENVTEIKNAKKAAGNLGKAQGPKSLAQGYGSDPFAAEDLLTRFSGMTQSEVSADWCGDNAVLGFNDSGSFVATLFLNASPSGSFSFNGFSRSRDRGGSYTDLGALVADPIPAGIMFRDLLGDPVIACTSSSNFYYASLAIDSGPDFSFINSGISVSPSTTGGASFGSAVMAVSKDGFSHFLDKPWMTASPGPTSAASDDVVHVTYTDFDFSGFGDPTAACPDASRTAIEHVRSIDGGQTWSPPTVLEENCGEVGFAQGSQVEAGAGDVVYVAWEHYDAFEGGRDIQIARSSDGGATFGPAQLVSSVTPVGDSFAVQGLFRAFLDLQGLAVDPNSGAVYISWHDGRNRSKVDPFGFCGGTPTYCFGDILLSKSTDQGESWSAPVRVNDDNPTLGVDQLFPALDVDRAGNVWVAYYDRRRDTRNLLIDTFLAKSSNGGGTWTNSRLTNQNFAAITGWQDVVVNPIYMGDYNALTVDSTGANSGVIVAWGDNSLGDANVAQTRK